MGASYRRRVSEPPLSTTDGRRLRGQRTRQLVLTRAVDMASAEGLDSLSLARLGADLGISKSGVGGHFASREDLQLAVIGVAASLYADRVAVPAAAAPAGLPQLWRLCDHWIEFMRSGELRGRSFFLTAMVEYDARPGPIRDELVRLRGRWQALFTGFLRAAQQHGHVHPDVDAEQLFFEVASVIVGATLDSQLRDDASTFDRARAAVLRRLRSLVPSEQSLSAALDLWVPSAQRTSSPPAADTEIDAQPRHG